MPVIFASSMVMVPFPPFAGFVHPAAVRSSRTISDGAELGSADLLPDLDSLGDHLLQLTSTSRSSSIPAGHWPRTCASTAASSRVSARVASTADYIDRISHPAHARWARSTSRRSPCCRSSCSWSAFNVSENIPLHRRHPRHLHAEVHLPRIGHRLLFRWHLAADHRRCGYGLRAAGGKPAGDAQL